MEFRLPGPRNGTFTIPDKWWHESGMDSFTVHRSYYRPSQRKEGVEMLLLPLERIWGRERTSGVPYLRKKAMIEILCRIREDKSIDPVEVMKPTEDNGYEYWLKDGFHRFRASVAAGYEKIPAIVSFNPDIE
jgi:hypothetical protein